MNGLTVFYKCPKWQNFPELILATSCFLLQKIELLEIELTNQFETVCYKIWFETVHAYEIVAHL